jgi:hypothetical protein
MEPGMSLDSATQNEFIFRALMAPEAELTISISTVHQLAKTFGMSVIDALREVAICGIKVRETTLRIAASTVPTAQA